MLKVEGLTFKFPHRTLFTGLSFSLSPGELLHIKGPNGVGKSTLIHVVAGFLAPASGEIDYFVEGNAVLEPRLYMEYLPSEGNALFLKMSAQANLAFWQRLRHDGSDLASIDAALDLWGLNHPVLKQAFPVERYSTGMKRRLALARLILAKAPLWLLDEPVYGLDLDALETFRKTLTSHLKGGGMALLVTHDESVIAGVAHRTLALEKSA